MVGKFSDHYSLTYYLSKLYAITFVLFWPNESRIDGLASVNDDALTGAEPVLDGKEICPRGNFLYRSPSPERGLLHDLIP